jgi:uncharacterized membrane protein
MEIIHAIFSICCHQYGDRSSYYYGEIFPVCDRCAGLYFGIFSSYLFIFLRRGGSHFSLDTRNSFFLTVLMFPLFIDGICNYFSVWSSIGTMRSVTGMLCGVPLPLFLISIRNSLFEVYNMKKLSSVYITLPVLISSLFILLLSHPPSYFIFCFLAIVAAMGMLAFFLNMLLTFFKIAAGNRLSLSRY